MSDMMGNTMVSQPGAGPGGGTTAAGAAPGANGPGGQMGMASAIGWVIVGSAAVYVGLGVVFRKGQKLPPLRIDAAAALANATSVAVIFGTAKLLATKYHGHKISQAVLLVL